MHNMPGIPIGGFAIRPGAIMASADVIEIDVNGKGGHGGATPHLCIDSILVGAQIVNALQSVVARNIDPMKQAVVSICSFNAGKAHNVIPATAKLLGTARSLDPGVRDTLERRITEITEQTAKAYGATAKVHYGRNYPVTVNHEGQTKLATSVAQAVAGAERVNGNMMPVMGGEDFSFMLEARPGAFIFIGNGDTAALHHPAYNFDDAVIPHGISYWAKLVETAMPAA